MFLYVLFDIIKQDQAVGQVYEPLVDTVLVNLIGYSAAIGLTVSIIPNISIVLFLSL